MGQKKKDRTKAWLAEQMEIELRQRTEKVLADYKARLKAKAEEVQHDEAAKVEDDQNETKND